MCHDMQHCHNPLQGSVNRVRTVLCRRSTYSSELNLKRKIADRTEWMDCTHNCCVRYTALPLCIEGFYDLLSHLPLCLTLYLPL